MHITNISNTYSTALSVNNPSKIMKFYWRGEFIQHKDGHKATFNWLPNEPTLFMQTPKSG